MSSLASDTRIDSAPEPLHHVVRPGCRTQSATQRTLSPSALSLRAHDADEGELDDCLDTGTDRT